MQFEQLLSGFHIQSAVLRTGETPWNRRYFPLYSYFFLCDNTFYKAIFTVYSLCQTNSWI